MLKYTNRTAILLLLLLLHIHFHTLQLIGCSTTGGEGPRTEVSERTEISNNVHTESVKVGNTKTKNYHIEAAEFRPTQLTQVVLNVPKLPKYLRKTRPPSREELLVKERILGLFNEVRESLGGAFVAPLEHLGSILEALNPKYISTERVVRAVFRDHQLPALLQPANERPRQNRANRYEEPMRSMLHESARGAPSALSATASASGAGASAAASASSLIDRYSYNEHPPAADYEEEEEPREDAGMADRQPHYHEPDYEVNALARRYFQSSLGRPEFPVANQHGSLQQARFGGSRPPPNAARYTSADSNPQRRYYMPSGSGGRASYERAPHYSRY